MAYSYRCGPTAALSNRTSWGPVGSPTTVDPKAYDRPLSGNYDRIFNAFEKTNAFQYVKNNFEATKEEERLTGHSDMVVNRKMSSSFERADCSLAALTPSLEDEEYYREKILYSQARQLYPLQEDLADWINKSVGISYLTGENFLDVLDNGVELCQLAAVIHLRAKEAIDSGLIVGPVPSIRGRCWQRAARRSFFSRDNMENFITFCRELGVHENLLFESDDLVLHNQPRQVILCLLEVARLATRYGVEPPGLVQLEREIALEERDSGMDSAMSGTAWQFRDESPSPSPAPARDKAITEPPPSSPAHQDTKLAVVDNTDAESTRSGDTVDSTDSDVPLKPTNELDKRVQLVTRLMERGCSCSSGKCSKLLKVKKVGEGRYNIAGRNVFIRLLKGRHMMVRVGGGWDTLEHFLSRHEPCQVRLVTQGRRGSVLPVTLSPPPPLPPPAVPLSRSGTVSPVDSKPSSLSGKISPIDRSRSSKLVSSGKSSPISEERRTSTPIKATLNKPRSALTLPLNKDRPAPLRKQSAPSLSTPASPAPTPAPATPTTRTRTPVEYRKSLTSSSLLTPKKSRSMSLALQKDDKFCGTDRLNKAKVTSETPKKTRSHSLATTPVVESKKSFCGTDKVNSFSKKGRSASLASTPVGFKPLNKSSSVTGGVGGAGGAITQAAIEESIRLSLAASIADHSTNKPFLHIKAKYRSPPPREVPPR